MLKLSVFQGKEKVAILIKDGESVVKLVDLLGQEFILVPVKPVEPEIGPVNWTWNDGQASRGRQPRCFVVSPAGEVFRFTHQDIPGVVKVLGSDYTKNGKWSNSTYRCISPAGTINVSWRQDWETGETFPQDTWEEAYAWLLSYAPNAKMESFEELVRQEFEKSAVKFDANREALKEFS